FTPSSTAATAYTGQDHRLPCDGPFRRPQFPPAGAIAGHGVTWPRETTDSSAQIGPAAQEPPSFARTTAHLPPLTSARRHPVGHTGEAPGDRIRAWLKCRASAPSLNVAPPNQAPPVMVALSNPASPVKATSSNEAPRLNVALSNHTSRLKATSPN